MISLENKITIWKKISSCLRVNVSLQVSLRHKKALHTDSFLEENIAVTLGWHQTGETIENDIILQYMIYCSI